MPVRSSPSRKWSGGSSEGQGSNPQVQQHQRQGQHNQPQLQPRRWGSNFSTQRRERVLWSSCLQKVRTLRRDGSWKTRSEQNAAVGDIRGEEDRRAHNTRAEEAGDANDLAGQLDSLATITYPNSSISPQDAGCMVAALSEAVPLSSEALCSRVAQFFITLCGKQQKVDFLTWQLEVTLDFLLESLRRQATAEGRGSLTPPPVSQTRPTSPPTLSQVPLARRECVRALSQLLYENGERLGTRFGDILPLVLRLSDSSTTGLETRHAALDALANLCLKKWAGFDESQGEAVCSCLAQNFDAHWRSLAFAADSPSEMVPAEHKVLASAARGLACAVSKAGVALALGSYLPRVVHALNHLVQPAGPGETSTRRQSGNRSRSRESSLDQIGSSAGLSPLRSGTRHALSDTRSRVRLQSTILLGAIASKDAKALFSYWALFFPSHTMEPASQQLGVRECRRGRAGNLTSEGSPVLPAGLIAVMEEDAAPQIRAAAAAAAAALIKNAPLRKWIQPARAALPPSRPVVPEKTGSGMTTVASGGGIGERTSSMMLHLHKSLVKCLAREESSAVLARLCACAGALMSELPYAVVPDAEEVAVGKALVHCWSPVATDIFEASLKTLLRILAGLMLDVSAEPGSRIAASQALTAVFSTKEPIVIINSFLLDFRYNGSPSDGTADASADAPEVVHGVPLVAPMLPRAGDSTDRSNRFLARAEVGTSSALHERAEAGDTGETAGGFRSGSGVRLRSAASGATDSQTPLGTLVAPLVVDVRNDVQRKVRTLSIGGPEGGASDSSFVDGLTKLATSGKLRTEALSLLTRVARSYPAHLSGGDPGGDGIGRGLGNHCHRGSGRWGRVSRLLLRGFADSDQNLRLHALKVLEALLLARAEKAGHDAEGSPSTGGAMPSFGAANAIGVDREHWGDLVQKHLQRALEDPYHGVRAVACSCHASLLAADWAAFPDEERGRCLDRMLAATRDRTAGVSVLACRVIAGLMTMAGRSGSSAWCRKPVFLERCANRMEEMMGDPKATIRSQAVIAVGNLSWSLHEMTRSDPDSDNVGYRCDESVPSPVAIFGPVARHRLRSLLEGTLRLAAAESSYAAGSAVRAVGYLAWCLDSQGCGVTYSGSEAAAGAGARCLANRNIEVSDDLDTVWRLAPVAAATATLDGGRACSDVLSLTELPPAEKAARETAVDRSLQDRAMLVLATMASGDDPSVTALTHDPPELGGGRVVERRADAAAAKCRWNCCIALGVLLSLPGVQARIAVASWGPVLLRSLCRAVEKDGHLKVRTHAAITLKTLPDPCSYGDELRAILGGALRSLEACRNGLVLGDPSQTRHVDSFGAGIRALVVHLFLLLALGAPGGTPESSGEDERCTPGLPRQCGFKSTNGVGTVASGAKLWTMDFEASRVPLLGEYGHALLMVISSPESDAALATAELLLHLEALARRRSVSLASQSLARVTIPPDHLAARPADVVLGAAADEIVRLFARDGPRKQVMANLTWQGWRNEARRRLLRGKGGDQANLSGFGESAQQAIHAGIIDEDEM